MLQGGVLIRDGTVWLLVYEYLTEEPKIVKISDPPAPPKDQSASLREYVIEAKTADLSRN